MRSTLRAIAIGLGAAWACSLAWAQAAAEVALTRFECGTSGPAADVGRFSDVFGHRGLMLQLSYSCYLIQHGDE